MKSESEIRERLDRIETDLEDTSGPDLSHLIGQRNILYWVLEEDSTVGEKLSSSSGGHWSGQGEQQQR